MYKVATRIKIGFMDVDIVFQLCEQDDSPGVLLKKDAYGNCTWIPIASS